MTVFVNKGDAPLTPVQLEKRAQTYIRRSWPSQAREKSIRTADGAFDAFMATFSANHDVNIANNTFNWQLAEYRKATARLEKYRLADGRAEYTIETPTGAFDEEGNEIMDVTVVPAIEPLPATVEQTTYDDEGNATVETVDNPEIVADDAERAAAQAVVDATPQEVKDFS
jgi:flagellin-like hook-associated protein FlgL